MQKSPYRTRSQDMAAFALEKVEAQKSSQRQGQYKSYAAKLPAMIVNNGLAATLAFMKDKGDQWNVLYEDLQAWFQQAGLLPKGQDLLKTVLGQPAVEYRRWTREALAVAEWIKRFASAELQGPAEE